MWSENVRVGYKGTFGAVLGDCIDQPEGGGACEINPAHWAAFRSGFWRVRPRCRYLPNSPTASRSSTPSHVQPAPASANRSVRYRLSLLCDKCELFAVKRTRLAFAQRRYRHDPSYLKVKKTLTSSGRLIGVDEARLGKGS